MGKVARHLNQCFAVVWGPQQDVAVVLPTERQMPRSLSQNQEQQMSHVALHFPMLQHYSLMLLTLRVPCCHCELMMLSLPVYLKVRMALRRLTVLSLAVHRDLAAAAC